MCIREKDLIPNGKTLIYVNHMGRPSEVGKY